jgi:hypothetical protein
MEFSLVYIKTNCIFQEFNNITWLAYLIHLICFCHHMTLGLIEVQNFWDISFQSKGLSVSLCSNCICVWNVN